MKSIMKLVFRKILPATAFAAAALTISGAVRAQDFDPDLVARAKKEGTVSFYSVGQLYKQLADAFEARFGIKVNAVRGDSQDLMLRLLNESRAGQPIADVFTLGGTGILTLKNANILKPFTLKNSAGIDPQYRDPNGYWAAVSFLVQVPALNTDLVPADKRPKSYEDLLDPYWKDKMVWKPNDVGSGIGFIGNILTTMGEERGMAYLEKLAKQHIRISTMSSFALTNQVIAGEYPMVLHITTNQVELGQQKGGPVAWAVTNPVSATFETVAIPVTTPHPNAGQLFAEFLLSKEAQQMYADLYYLTPRRDIPIKTKAISEFKFNYLTPEIFDTGEPKWTEIFNRLFR